MCEEECWNSGVCTHIQGVQVLFLLILSGDAQGQCVICQLCVVPPRVISGKCDVSGDAWIYCGF